MSTEALYQQYDVKHERRSGRLLGRTGADSPLEKYRLPSPAKVTPLAFAAGAKPSLETERHGGGGDRMPPPPPEFSRLCPYPQ